MTNCTRTTEPGVYWVFAAVLAGSFATCSAQELDGDQQYSELTVQVSGAEPGHGQILFSLFSSPQNYLSSPIQSSTRQVSSSGGASTVFEELAAGLYSVSVIYDEDGNGKLNTGFLGIPKEKVGFSNNVKGRFGPPSFDKTSFELDQSTHIEILLKRVKK